MSEYYLWFKAIHIIFVITWMAGMFYLPRLFAYHTEVKVGSEEDKRFQTMERRLMRIIINPSMILTIFFGLILIHIYGLANLGPWFHIKALLVIIMIALHIFFSIWRKNFEKGKNKLSRNFYRIVNEAPPILMIIIVILVVVKPFD
jgi:putative membrane protein